MHWALASRLNLLTEVDRESSASNHSNYTVFVDPYWSWLGSGRKSAKLKATLSICGGPIVGQALTLLLRGSGYTVRLLLAQSFGEPQALKDVRVLVLAPTPGLSTEHRNALVTSLKEMSEAKSVPVLELVTPCEAGRRREEEAESESWYTVPWPCRIEELERQIEAALMRHYETRGEGNGNPLDPGARL
jgi:hypothetical protein